MCALKLPPSLQHPTTVAALMDKLLLEGPIDLVQGAKIADKFRHDHGYKTEITRGVFRAHARFRERVWGWRLEMNDEHARLIREPE